MAMRGRMLPPLPVLPTPGAHRVRAPKGLAMQLHILTYHGWWISTLGQQDLYQWAYARLMQLGAATLPPFTTDTGGHTSSSSGQGRGGSHVQSSGLTDSLYSGYETLTSDTHSSTERMIEGELWVRVEGVWCRAYERISDPIDTSRAPLIRSSFGLHYSTPSTAQPAPSKPPQEGRLCRNLREAYASPDAEMGNGSLPSNLSTLDRPAPGSSPGVPVSGPTVPSTTLQSHAAVGSPDSVNNGRPSTDMAGPDAAIDGSCNAAVGATSLVSCQAPTVSFPRPDEATLAAACTSLYLDLLQAHERDPLAPFLLLLRFLPIEAIFDAVLAQCTTERQRIMVTNNILRLWHLASTDLPNDSILARPRRGAASVSSQDTGGSFPFSFTCILQVFHCFLHEHVHWQGLWRSPLTLRRCRAYLFSLPNRPPLTCNQLPGPLDTGAVTGCDAEPLLAKVSPLLGCPSLGPSVVFLIHGGGPSSQPSADIGRSRCLWAEATPNSLCLATAVDHCSLHGVYQSTSVYVCRSITVIPNNRWFNNTAPFMWHSLGYRLLLLRHALRHSIFRTQGPAHLPTVPAETAPKFPTDNLSTVGHCLPPTLPERDEAVLASKEWAGELRMRKLQSKGGSKGGGKDLEKTTPKGEPKGGKDGNKKGRPGKGREAPPAE